MTYKEAADILDPETSLAALAEIEYFGGFSGQETVLEAVNEACCIAARALREKENEKAN